MPKNIIMNKLLFPSYLKYLGFILLGIGLTLIILQMAEGTTSLKDFFLQSANIEIFAIYAILLLGSVLVTFSKEKKSDEYIESLRLKAFSSSIIVHSIFFFVFSFTNLTLFLVNFPAIILMNSILILYIIFYYSYKLKS